MAIFCGSFSLEESSSFRKLGRSNSSILASELENPEISRIAAYERISKSMRWTIDESDTRNGDDHRRTRAWRFVSKVFSLKKMENGSGKKRPAAETKPEKKQSRWLPDPHRRWPVQGW